MRSNVASGNRPPPERIESWAWGSATEVPSQVSLASDQQPGSAAATLDFDLMQHWKRGGFKGSLFANSDGESEEFLDRLIANFLPTITESNGRNGTIAPNNFWRLLAQYNGCPLESLRRKLQLGQDPFHARIGKLLANDLMLTLPYWPKPGVPAGWISSIGQCAVGQSVWRFRFDKLKIFEPLEFRGSRPLT